MVLWPDTYLGTTTLNSNWHSKGSSFKKKKRKEKRSIQLIQFLLLFTFLFIIQKSDVIFKSTILNFDLMYRHFPKI